MRLLANVFSFLWSLLESRAVNRIALIVLALLCVALVGCGLINRVAARAQRAIPAPVSAPSAPAPAVQVATAAPASVTPTVIPGATTPRTPASATAGATAAAGLFAAPRLIGTYVPPLDAPKYCPQMASDGAKFTWTAVPWDGIEPTQGQFYFKRADSVILAMHNCGLDIGVHILSRNQWATLPVPNIPTKNTASMPPKDMNQYYNFVFQLASHYKGVVSRYSVENEAHASANWPSSPDSYFQMLATAYRAVHAADPNAIVEDSALSSSALGLLYANELNKSGQTQAAVDFLHNYFATFSPETGGGGPLSVNNAQDMNRLFALAEVQRAFTWAPMLFANHAYYDVEQLHYFGPWSDLPTIMGWIHSQLKAQGTDKPLDLWEMGFAWTNLGTFDPQNQAREVPKYMAVAIGEGGLRALSWLFTDVAFKAEGHPGLITDTGPRPAAEAFKVVAAKLNGTTNSVRLNLGTGIYGYQYDTPNGTEYALWSDQPAKAQLPAAGTTATITDITGKVTTGDPRSLDVSTSPIFVEVK